MAADTDAPDDYPALLDAATTVASHKAYATLQELGFSQPAARRGGIVYPPPLPVSAPLVAAGGWCAPSVIEYDLFDLRHPWRWRDAPFAGLQFDALVAPRLTATLARWTAWRRRVSVAWAAYRKTDTTPDPWEDDDCAC